LRIGVDISFEKVRVFTQASTATARYYALDICIEIRSAIPKISKIVTDASLDLPENLENQQAIPRQEDGPERESLFKVEWLKEEVRSTGR
jgi:hypothetical protein